MKSLFTSNSAEMSLLLSPGNFVYFLQAFAIRT